MSNTIANFRRHIVNADDTNDAETANDCHCQIPIKTLLLLRQAQEAAELNPEAPQLRRPALRELQKNTRTLSRSRPSSEPTIVLKGILKPVGSKISEAVNGARDLGSEDEEQEKESGGSFRRDKDDAKSRLAYMEIDKDRSKYPDQATIEAIAAAEIQSHRAGFYCIGFRE